MGKLKCKCGHIIVDQTDNLEYKGYVLPDTLVDDVSINLTNNIDSLIESLKKGNKTDWIKKHFQVPPYPMDLKESSMIHDLLNVSDKTQEIFECENCGRIAIEFGNTNQFRFFTPESDDTRGILNGKKK
ncbi:hypothetical protein [Winogradskyella alexanderae]|uniref:Uncharacterized protein n=1 Tax=Winogradskyella alexanderae TaxID=2877123 RepID=A0ABS7XX06_9FLAO|nr:hypothetical protein [Winogradskyella alexanderae]MCA0133943.1 hypothetical protein [Winogradskyella alexanderae]